MSDYIKRSDAVDAVMNTKPVFDTNLEPYQKTRDVVVAIKSLPAADICEDRRGECIFCSYYEDEFDE